MSSSTPKASPASSSAESSAFRGIQQELCPACGHVNATIDYGWIKYCQGCYTYVATERETQVVYDAAYVRERYDRYTTTHLMSERRLDILEQVIHLYETLPIGREIRRGRLLDVGYGNGSLIRRATLRGWDAYGNDVNPAEYEGVRKVPLPITPLPIEERYRCVTFYDALEHFEDLSGPRAVSRNTDWLVVTVPKAPQGFLSGEWKHKRPGEHHFYWWYAKSFESIFSGPHAEATLVYVDSPEDSIRGKLPDGLDNTMTAVLRCRPTSPVMPQGRT